jgi:hypothetical protein
LIAACSSTIEWKLPRLSRRRVSAEKKVSTAFSHELEGRLRLEELERRWRGSSYQ